MSADDPIDQNTTPELTETRVKGHTPCTWVLIGTSLAVFSGLAWAVQDKPSTWDNALLQNVIAIRQPWLTPIVLGVTHSASIVLLAPLTLLCAYLLWRRANKRASFFMGMAMLGSAIINQIAKYSFARHRPPLAQALIEKHSFSFPSGHTMGMATFGLACLLVVESEWPKHKNSSRWAALIMITLVALSRVYLGVHYPTDVLASVALSLAWVLTLDRLCALYATKRRTSFALTLNSCQTRSPKER